MPETDTIRAVEEEQTVSEQNIEGAAAVKQPGGPDETTNPKETNGAAAPLHHKVVEGMAWQDQQKGYKRTPSYRYQPPL